MSLNLTKGDSLNLTKATNNALTVLHAGAGWDMATEGATIDIDLSAFLLKDGKLIGGDHAVCFFNQKSVCDGAVASMGDNLTGEGDGDDETIVLKLTELPDTVDEVLLVLNIYDAAKKGQAFNQVSNAFVRVYDPTNGNTELAKIEVSGITDTYDSLVFASVKRGADGWTITALNDFRNADLGALIASYK